MPCLPPASVFRPAAVPARGWIRAAARIAATVVTLTFPPVGQGAGFLGAARADDAAIVCTREPREHWMSAAAISEKAVRAGYPDIRHIKVVGTCYEIDALTARRMPADVVMDPVTGDVVQAWMGRLPE